jgi:SAM-dependent methyltransferase
MRKNHIEAGFPASALSLIRCPADGGELHASVASEFIKAAKIFCLRCVYTARIDGGILDLLDPESLDVESSREVNLREVEWAGAVKPITDLDLAEMQPHIEALQIRPGYRLLEFGCGTGRYTLSLAPHCSLIIAVDFSRAALVKIAQQAPKNTALVRADATKIRTKPGSFDGVLSTLTSNLPVADHRRMLYAAAAEALNDGGTLVSGTHHYGIHARLSGLVRNGRYSENGIYRSHNTRVEIQSEVGSFFRDVRVRPVQVLLPYSRTLGLPLLRISRLAERIPGLREFGMLLLTVARQPRAWQ